MRGVFITGTDTGVGKTRAACALLRALAARGVRAVGMKPVASGAVMGPQGWLQEDVEALRAASAVAAPRELVNPYCFEPAIAPHIAAARAGVTISLDVIAAAARELSTLAEVVVAEGAGGLLVPLNAREDTADLAARLRWPVIIVVALRLGCLNHALLTRVALHARGLACAGWIASRVNPVTREDTENIAALEQRMAAPLLAVIPHLPDDHDGTQAAGAMGDAACGAVLHWPACDGAGF